MRQAVLVRDAGTSGRILSSGVPLRQSWLAGHWPATAPLLASGPRAARGSMHAPHEACPGATLFVRARREAIPRVSVSGSMYENGAAVGCGCSIQQDAPAARPPSCAYPTESFQRLSSWCLRKTRIESLVVNQLITLIARHEGAGKRSFDYPFVCSLCLWAIGSPSSSLWLSKSSNPAAHSFLPGAHTPVLFGIRSVSWNNWTSWLASFCWPGCLSIARRIVTLSTFI